MVSFARVVVPPLPQPFLYEVPSDLEERIEIGLQVLVPLGPRKAQGYVIETGISREALGEISFTIKPIHSRSLLYPIFLPEQISFFEWIANYYGSSLSQVIDCAVPPFVPALERQIFQKGPQTEISEKLGPKQKEILSFILEHPEGVEAQELRKRFPGFTQRCGKLLEMQLLEKRVEEERKPHPFSEEAPGWAKKEVALNAAQENAVAQILPAIQKGLPENFLLHGITGSGKTEVYIALIEEALRQDRGALVIVPEIALTPQLFDRFQARLGNSIAMLHSGMSKRHRWEFWRGLLEGKYRVAMGARSAVFAPVLNLGLLIVDEEHDSSFKQGEGLRYHGRDLAVVRALRGSLPVVLGSATPSLETWENVRKGKYTKIDLPQRFGSAKRAAIEIVDLREIKPWEMISPHVSPRLYAEMINALERKEQIFLLYNRRGFASYLFCSECGDSLGCPNCSVTLTYHRGRNKLQCHYCGYEQFPPKPPHDCSGERKQKMDKDGNVLPPRFQESGAGTEKIVEEIASLFPLARVERLDRDSAKTTSALVGILQRVREHEVDILIGTQMIAKGHDIPNVTLVGIVDADVGLHMPDFRAGERAFQLLTQVAGRAGRSTKPGCVILQTRVPANPAIVHSQTHDFDAFADEELKSRKAWSYPPSQRLLRVLVSAEDPKLPSDQLRIFRDILREWMAEQKAMGKPMSLQILGPAPAPLERVKGLYRFHLLCKANSSKELNYITKIMQDVRPLSKNARIVFDIDPQDML